MDSPSPTDRRRAWVRSSRHWLTLEEADPREAEVPQTPDPQTDEVFLEGSTAGKIESWLQNWGPEENPEDLSRLTVESFLKPGNSFEDDLSLGAEAIALHREEDGTALGECPLLLPPPRPRQKYPASKLGSAGAASSHRLSPFQFLSLGHSMASSGFSSTTSKTASSVSEVLQLCTEDAEETLYNLGFGMDEPQITAKIPPRFLNFPSQLKGINFRLFLESQLRRIKEEDPDLSLASRFRQVEVLTAMANAFYSLYSHVSKTPVQKLAPPEFSFSSPIEKISMRFNSVKSEPKSPVDRLKDTVSKMCLYRGSRDLASPSPSPSASPRKRSSLPNVVEMVMENTKSEAFRNLGLAHFEEQVGSLAGAYLSAVCSSKDSRQCRSIPGGLELLCTLASDEVTWNSPMEDLKELSKQGCVDPDPSTLPQTARFTQDVICPRIIERVHKKPFSYGRLTGSPKGGHLGSANVTPDSGYKTSPCCQQDKADSREAGESDVAEGNGTSRTTGQSRSRCPAGGPRWAQDPCEGTDSLGCTHLSHPSSGVWVPVPQCQITVTGWDGKVDPDAPLDKHSGTDGCTQNHDSWEPQDQSYMTPAKPPSLGSVLQHPPQANSFDLEEVHSAGEEDVSQSEARGVVTLSPLSAVKRHRDLMLREDSLQSDSSGFVEEDYQAHTSMGAEREEER